MLDYLRQRSQSAVIIFFVAAISLVFIVQFGPQSQGCGTERMVWLAKVHGTTLNLTDYRWVERLVRSNYRLPREYVDGGRFGRDIVNGLIERELFAHHAYRIGLAVSVDQIDEAVRRRGEIYFSWPAGGFIPIRGPLRLDFRNDDGLFQSDDFEGFLSGLNLSKAAFAEQQTSEMLAERVRQMVEISVQISDEELWAEYSRSADRVNLDYVRVYPQFFRDALRPTDAELAGWARDHNDEVEERYEADRFRYTNVRKQVRVHDIMVKLRDDAEDDENSLRRQRAEAILELAKAPDADLGLLARCFSDDRQGSARSGDLGYLRKGMSRFGREYDEAIFAMEKGTLSGLIETKQGLHIVQVIDQREGDVTIDQARLEIAENLYRKQRGSKRAREVIDGILARVTEGSELDDSLLSDVPELQPDECPALPEIEVEEGEEEEPQRRRLQPVIQQTGFFNRSGVGVPGIGESSELMNAAFELTDENPVSEEVIEVRDDLFVVRLAEDGRQQATREEFEEQRPTYEQRLVRRKRQEALRIFALRLRREAEAEGEITENQEGIRFVTRTEEEEEEGEEGEGEGEGEGESRGSGSGSGSAGEGQAEDD